MQFYKTLQQVNIEDKATNFHFKKEVDSVVLGRERMIRSNTYVHMLKIYLDRVAWISRLAPRFRFSSLVRSQSPFPYLGLGKSIIECRRKAR